MNFMLLVILAASICQAADVEWTRFKGRVKFVDQKASRVTIQDGEGDLITLKVNEDVTILQGKDAKHLGDLSVDDKVILVNAPKVAKPKESEEPEAGGVYKPLR